MLVESLVGILSSLATQAVKREKAGSLENILLAGGAAFGGTQLAETLGYVADPAMTVVAGYAWHGLTGGQKPMQALKFATVDKLLEGIAAAFKSASSRNGS